MSYARPDCPGTERADCLIGSECSPDGRIIRGLCNRHYIRLRKYGDPLADHSRESRRGEPDAIPHGTASGWHYHACRCGECRTYSRRAKHDYCLRPGVDGRARARRYANRERENTVNQKWRIRNREYHRELNRRNAQRYRSLVPSTTARRGRWSAAEITILKRTDLLTTEKALILNRTHAAITSKLYDLRQAARG